LKTGVDNYQFSKLISFPTVQSVSCWYWLDWIVRNGAWENKQSHRSNAFSNTQPSRILSFRKFATFASRHKYQNFQWVGV